MKPRLEGTRYQMLKQKCLWPNDHKALMWICSFFFLFLAVVVTGTTLLSFWQAAHVIALCRNSGNDSLYCNLLLLNCRTTKLILLQASEGAKFYLLVVAVLAVTAGLLLMSVETMNLWGCKEVQTAHLWTAPLVVETWIVWYSVAVLLNIKAP